MISYFTFPQRTATATATGREVILRPLYCLECLVPFLFFLHFIPTGHVLYIRSIVDTKHALTAVRSLKRITAITTSFLRLTPFVPEQLMLEGSCHRLIPKVDGLSANSGWCRLRRYRCLWNFIVGLWTVCNHELTSTRSASSMISIALSDWERA